MLKKDPNFQRLKLGGRGWNGSASYWLGPDHLLVVEVLNYTERYRRFYFRDIQAIVVQQSRQQLWGNLILGGLLMLALVVVASIFPASGAWTTGDYVGIYGIMTGVLLLIYAMSRNTFLGPTCTMHVRTAVQTQKLKNLNRWRHAEKLVKQLQPLVLAAQGAQEASASAVPIAGSSVVTEIPPVSDATIP
jgi:hypothetical protein